jgi:hypothetical protein
MHSVVLNPPLSRSVFSLGFCMYLLVLILVIRGRVVLEQECPADRDNVSLQCARLFQVGTFEVNVRTCVYGSFSYLDGSFVC